MDNTNATALRIAARFRSASTFWRWVLLLCGGAITLSLDSTLVDSSGFPMLPSIGAWIITVGWLWGRGWSLATLALTILAIGVGISPPPLNAWPTLICFSLATVALRALCPIFSPNWNGRIIAIGAVVASLTAIVSAIPFATHTVWQFGPRTLDLPMLWLRVFIVPPIATLAWLTCLASLYRLADERVLTSPFNSRWGWPNRTLDTLGMLGIGGGIAILLALSPPLEQWPWALIAAILMVLAAALSFNLVGGAVGALFGCLGSSMVGGLETATEVTLTNTYLSHAVLILIGLVAGSFASRARARQDEWTHNVWRYRSLLETLPIGLVELDERGLITQANPMAGTIVGCDPADLLGHPFNRLGTENKRAALADTMHNIRHKNQPTSRFITNFLYRPNATARDVQVDWVYQQQIKRHGPMRVTALISDITERLRAINALKHRENQLAERSNLLRVTMDSLDHGLAAFSADNMLTEWNSKFPEMLRLPAPLFRRNTPAIAIFRFLATLGAFGVGVTESQVQDRINLLLHEPNQDDVPWIGQRHLRFTAHTMPDGGWVWSIADRTEDIRALEIEHHRQKMEALGQLASGVAHELNNTLQPMLSLSELGSSQVEADSILAKCFSRITDAAERAETIVRGVLTFARNAPAAADDCAIIQALHENIAFISAGLPPQIHLDVSVDDAIPAGAMAHLDRREMGQVLTNLITNAADAMNHKGTIQVTCRSDLFRYVTENETTDSHEEVCPAVAISVIDTGIGMDHITRQRIFEPFYTTKDEGHGTGLGLAVAFGLVRDWGGRIDVESEVGFGTTFTIWVPLLVDNRTHDQPVAF